MAIKLPAIPEPATPLALTSPEFKKLDNQLSAMFRTIGTVSSEAAAKVGTHLLTMHKKMKLEVRTWKSEVRRTSK